MSTILYVSGHSLKDEKKHIDLNHGLCDISPKANALDIFPKIYYSGETKWPGKTKNTCFRCDCQMLYRRPVFISNGVYQNPETGKFGYLVERICCSFACAYTQLFLEQMIMSKDEYDERLILLKQLYKGFYGEDIKKFTFAPNKSRRKKNGGELTDKEYQELISR